MQLQTKCRKGEKEGSDEYGEIKARTDRQLMIKPKPKVSAN